MREGSLSVSAEHIFPIIRQWLYSEKDIFLRELLANACDAVHKRDILVEKAEASAYADNERRIKVCLRADERLLEISDPGVGMNDDELERYINRIAYSGLLDFMERYQSQGEQAKAMIGHFGLGFYSAFMVAQKVEIETLSCRSGERAWHWESDNGEQYLLREGERTEIGTCIRLHLDDEAFASLTESRVQDLLERYAVFMSVPIDWHCGSTEARQVNEPEPLYVRPADSLKDEDYLAFYHRHFPGEEDPRFWLRLNMDYPFRLKGLLYFPRQSMIPESLAGRIRVYCNQVYVDDNLRSVVPDFLFLLQGFLDCPDLPLNVSRSYLQTDETVQKMNRYIIRKLAETLQKQFEDDRARFEENWPSLRLFMAYGMLQDEKFAEKAEKFFLLENYAGELKTLEDLGEGEHLYADLEAAPSLYLQALHKEAGDLLKMQEAIDSQWMPLIEYRSQGKHRFVRFDASLGQNETLTEWPETLTKLVEDYYQLPCQFVRASLGAEQLPLYIEENEELRRLKKLFNRFEQQESPEQLQVLREMLKERPETLKVCLNSDHPLLQNLSKETDEQAKERLLFALQAADLARGAAGPEVLSAFVSQAMRYCSQTDNQ